MLQTVAGPARLPVTDGVGEDDEKALRVEELAGSEELPGESIREETGAGAGCSVHDQHSVTHLS